MRNAFDAQGRKRDWYCEDVFTGDIEMRLVFEDDLVLAFHHPRPRGAAARRCRAEEAHAVAARPRGAWHVTSPL
jgi:hypothetical protein